MKDPVPDGLRSRVVYKFVCAGCNACYVGETCRHFSTCVREHLLSDRASYIFKHLKDSPVVFNRQFPCFRSRLHQLLAWDKRGYSYSKRATIFESAQYDLFSHIAYDWTGHVESFCVETDISITPANCNRQNCKPRLFTKCSSFQISHLIVTVEFTPFWGYLQLDHLVRCENIKF